VRTMHFLKNFNIETFCNNVMSLLQKIIFDIYSSYFIYNCIWTKNNNLFKWFVNFKRNLNTIKILKFSISNSQESILPPNDLSLWLMFLLRKNNKAKLVWHWCMMLLCFFSNTILSNDIGKGAMIRSDQCEDAHGYSYCL
jgi:hypothetical protein